LFSLGERVVTFVVERAQRDRDRDDVFRLHRYQTAWF
jgi:hypothetical protein